ncbi:MAG: hypothetical protein CVU51_14880 [Deltaproteobacteria bacterium HGW-Deltaproteobacteria-1]|nr:MAG: hypothetical protein CVU51_14880 [Deltaproteobacteria bacterium HGW-Deltaproteobacteria-1]
MKVKGNAMRRVVTIFLVFVVVLAAPGCNKETEQDNYEGIKGLLLGYFFRYPKISAYINNLTISVENSSARAEFQTVLTSGEKTGSMADVIPNSLGVWDFDVTLKKESNDWKVTSAKWEESEIMKTGEQ